MNYPHLAIVPPRPIIEKCPIPLVIAPALAKFGAVMFTLAGFVIGVIVGYCILGGGY